MKRAAAAVLLAALLLLMPGCAGRNQDRIVIGFSVQNKTEEYMLLLEKGLEHAVAQYDNVKLVVADGEFRIDKQAFQVDSFVSQGVAGIVLACSDADAISPMVREAIEAGIPVVAVANDVNNAPGHVYCGSDEIHAASVEMQYVADRLGGKGRVAILLGPLGSTAALNRRKGYQVVLDQYPDIEVVFEQTANWMRDEAMTLVENWLSSGEKLDAIVSENDGMALGAVEAIYGANRQDEIFVTGVDGVADALYSIQEGRLAATCQQDAFGQAEIAVEMILRSLRGEPLQDSYVPMTLITSDNVQEGFDNITIK